MLGWILAFVLFVCLIAYVILDYKTKGYERLAISSLTTENRDLKEQLKRTKRTGEYSSNRRLEDLESYIKDHIQKNKPDTAFTATFEAVGLDSNEEFLHKMFKRATTEILIASPWIKEGAWKRLRPRIVTFINNGGALTVFIKGQKEDCARGASDRSVIDEIRSHGGDVKFVPKLHAKVYVVDRREALITSANLTRSGLDFGYEAGIWTCNPLIVTDVCAFIDQLSTTNEFA